jgi:hypothetical protein
MGMLAKAGAAHEEPAKEAKKKEQKKKAEVPSEGKPQATHAGKGPPPPESSSHPGLEGEGDGRSNPSEPEDEGDGEAEDSDPNTPAGDSEADGSDDGGGDVDSPQSDQDQEAQGADEGGDAGDAEQGAGQDASPQSAGDNSAPDADAGQGQGQGQGDFNIADLTKMPIPPALKEEWLKANAALMTALYQNDKVAQAVLQGIVPQGIHKIESVVHMSLTLFFQINKQLNFMQDAKQISMAFLNQVIAHVVDLATQVKQIPFSDKEVSAAVSAGQEMLMRIHGATKGQMRAVAQHIPKSELRAQLAKYQQHTRDVHNVTGRFNQQAGGAQPPAAQAPPQGGQPANGGPPAAGGAGAPQTAGPTTGPTGGAGGTPGGQPQPGAPVTAAPGQGQSAPPGGMLSQAANQPPGQ